MVMEIMRSLNDVIDSVICYKEKFPLQSMISSLIRFNKQLHNEPVLTNMFTKNPPKALTSYFRNLLLFSPRKTSPHFPRKLFTDKYYFHLAHKKPSEVHVKLI